MTADQRKLVLQQVSNIGAIISTLAGGRSVEQWPARIQSCLDIIAETVADDANHASGDRT